jgi:ABC-type lipoprotein export system ATPase subunit
MWDLHIHTPASHTAHYGGESGWDRFLEELASLPPQMRVIGINDYLWVDGYKRVLECHAAGRLPNIEAVFPVVELRLRDFVGTTGKLSRLNAHAIFSPATPPELIETQFIAALRPSFKLSDQYAVLGTRWNALPTREAMCDLGRLIKESVPEERRPDFGPDFIEGFNAWSIPLDRVVEALRNSSFIQRPLLALGKTEWEDIPWEENTIAAKKHLISQADLVFTAAATPSAWERSVSRLRGAGVNYRLLDCSDAHRFKDSADKDRLGNSATWICADPTLSGLKHALIEFESRVFVGEKPPLLARMAADPTHFVRSVAIRPVEPTVTPPPSFDVEIGINGGFVAIIGNKGSGKSALLDTIALAGNASSEADFSFLSKQRYRNPRSNKALHYEVLLTMGDGEQLGPLGLAVARDPDKPERVRYLPQSLLEKLCNKSPDTPDDGFEAELRSIIFSHVPEHQRLGADSLDELVGRRSEAIDHEIQFRRSELSELNGQIAELEEALRPSRRTSLRARLIAARTQLAQHESARPPDPTPPAPPTDPDVLAAVSDLETTRDALTSIAEERHALEAQYSTARGQLDAGDGLARELNLLRATLEEFEVRVVDLTNALNLELSDLLSYRIDEARLTEAREVLESTVRALDAQLAPDSDLARRLAALEQRRVELEAALDRPRRRFEQQRRELEDWEAARERLVGSATVPDTVNFLVAQLEELDLLPGRVEELRHQRVRASEQIHGLLVQKVEIFRELYSPVQQFLEHHSLAADQFSLQFDAGLESRDFVARFVLFLDRGAAGTFYGVEQSERHLQGRVAAFDPQDWTSVRAFLQETELDLRHDRRPAGGAGALDCASEVLRKGVGLWEVYDYLFGLQYLDTQYDLRSDGRPITELSPGQKGTILLMFYLLVDRSGVPIALDQPDENLDSATIHRILRPAIREAKAHRQVIVVTHSPNLAVVGDADQVIVAMGNGQVFSYECGAIEAPEIRDLVVEVLEGTWPAYTDRGRKYRTSTDPSST